MSISVMERRQAHTEYGWNGVQDGDTLHYNRYEMPKKKSEFVAYGTLMYTISMRGVPGAIRIELYNYKNKKFIDSCSVDHQELGRAYIAEIFQGGMTHQRVVVTDSQQEKYTIVMMFDGKLEANKR